MKFGKLTLAGIVAATMALSGCTQMLIGGAAAVGADKYVENKDGGDGLF